MYAVSAQRPNVMHRTIYAWVSRINLLSRRLPGNKRTDNVDTKSLATERECCHRQAHFTSLHKQMINNNNWYSLRDVCDCCCCRCSYVGWIGSVCISILTILIVSWMDKDKMPLNCSALVTRTRMSILIRRRGVASSYTTCVFACTLPSASIGVLRCIEANVTSQHTWYNMKVLDWVVTSNWNVCVHVCVCLAIHGDVCTPKHNSGTGSE